MKKVFCVWQTETRSILQQNAVDDVRRSISRRGCTTLREQVVHFRDVRMRVDRTTLTSDVQVN